MIGSANLNVMIKAARKAGRSLVKDFQEVENLQVSRKGAGDFVSKADIAAEKLLKEELMGARPTYGWLAEEGGETPGEDPTRRWIVDPLDGTKEFIKRNGEFSVNIALVHENKAVLGVVFAPVLQTTYVASLDNGAYKSEQQQSAVKMQVSKVGESLRITASRSHPGPRTQAYLGKLSETLGPHSFVPMGSSLKSCVVADGLADLYPRFGKTSEWDTAACQVIVEEAGGVMQTMQGEPIRYNTKESLLNPEFMVFGDDSVDWAALYQEVIKK